jgi:hypothetical protein
VYTDLSYFFLAYKETNWVRRRLRQKRQDHFQVQLAHLAEALGSCAKLRRRTLCGTDWYMMFGETSGELEVFNDILDVYDQIAGEIDRRMPAHEPDLRTSLAVVNPVRFYRLAEIETAYSAQLKELGANRDECDVQSERIRNIIARAQAADPDLKGDSAISNPCCGCTYNENNTCGLVKQMGFKEDGSYDYEKAQKA